MEVGTFRLKGATPIPGVETYFLNVLPDGSLSATVTGSVAGSFTPAGLFNAGLITVLAIDDTQWYAAPPSALVNRTNISIQNQSASGILLWNYSNSAPATEGFWLTVGGSRSLLIAPGIPVYVRMLSGSGTACIEELS